MCSTVKWKPPILAYSSFISRYWLEFFLQTVCYRGKSLILHISLFVESLLTHLIYNYVCLLVYLLVAIVVISWYCINMLLLLVFMYDSLHISPSERSNKFYKLPSKHTASLKRRRTDVKPTSCAYSVVFLLNC